MANNNNTENVAILKPVTTGAIYYGEAGATVPTSASAALTGFSCVGYIGEDGVTKAVERESEDIKDWGGEVIKTVQTDYSATYQFVMTEALNETALKAFYGDDNVTVSDDTITIKGNSSELPIRAWVIDAITDEGKAYREVIPKGKISDTGDISYKKDEAAAYDITVTALPDSDGQTHYIYIG